MVVDGAISMKNVKAVEDEGNADLYCFIIRDKEEDDW